MAIKRSTNKEIARDSFNTLAINIICAILAVISSIFVSRFLGAEAKGMVNKMQILSQGMIILFSFGITTATIHYVAKFGLKNVVRSIKLLYGFTVGATLLFTTGLIFAYLAPVTGIEFIDSLTALIKHYYVNIPIELFFITAIYTIISIFNSLFLCIIRAKNNFVRHNLIVLINTVLMTFISILLYFFDTSIAYMLSSTAVVMIACILCLYTIKRNLPSEEDLPAIPIGRKTMLNYGLKIYLPNVLSFFSQYGTSIVLGGTGSTSNVELGVYSIYSTLTQKLWLIPDAVGSVLMSRISAMGHQADKTRITVLSCKVISVIMIFITPIFFLGAYYILPTLLGSDYVIAANIIVLLLIGSYFTCFTRILSSSLNAYGRPELNIAPSALGTLVNILGAFYIVGSSNHILAAAEVACFSQILQSIFTVSCFCVLYKVKFATLFIPTKQEFAMIRPIIAKMIPRRKS